MAQRRGLLGEASPAATTFLPSRPPLSALGQPEEHQSIPACTCHRPRYRTKRVVARTLVFKTVRQNSHLDGPVPIHAGQQGTGNGGPRIKPRTMSWWRSKLRRDLLAEIGIVGDLERAAVRP